MLSKLDPAIGTPWADNGVGAACSALVFERKICAGSAEVMVTR